MKRQILSNVTLVLPDSAVEGSLIVEEGRIAEIWAIIYLTNQAICRILEIWKPLTNLKLCKTPSFTFLMPTTV